MKSHSHQRYSHYRFKRHIDIDSVQDALTLAVCEAGGVHGRSRVRLDGWWWLDRQRRSCTIDASTQVGQDIARLFTGYLAKEFGEKAFTVQRPENGRRREGSR
jgi:hypothetical protein